MYYIGCDPGKNGACVVLTEQGDYEAHHDYCSPHDLARFLRGFLHVQAKAMIEKPIKIPQFGDTKIKTNQTAIQSMGELYGVYAGIFAALNIPYEGCTPQQWQKKVVGKLPKKRYDRKRDIANFVKAKCPELPIPRVEDWDRADAYCLAQYLRSL